MYVALSVANFCVPGFWVKEGLSCGLSAVKQHRKSTQLSHSLTQKPCTTIMITKREKILALCNRYREGLNDRHKKMVAFRDVLRVQLRSNEIDAISVASCCNTCSQKPTTSSVFFLIWRTLKPHSKICHTCSGAAESHKLTHQRARHIMRTIPCTVVTTTLSAIRSFRRFCNQISESYPCLRGQQWSFITTVEL